MRLVGSVVELGLWVVVFLVFVIYLFLVSVIGISFGSYLSMVQERYVPILSMVKGL